MNGLKQNLKRKNNKQEEEEEEEEEWKMKGGGQNGQLSPSFIIIPHIHLLYIITNAGLQVIKCWYLLFLAQQEKWATQTKRERNKRKDLFNAYMYKFNSILRASKFLDPTHF